MIKNVTRYKRKKGIINYQTLSVLSATSIIGHVQSQAIFFCMNDAREKERKQSHGAFD